MATVKFSQTGKPTSFKESRLPLAAGVSSPEA
jgi:hypothetical protein